ncbi:MAG: hypothetical protein QOJ65_1727, partial [Fimbriimonadaceae bacterium]|nr:hypothetical protein [Fimbriimonadaceae bacterium]
VPNTAMREYREASYTMLFLVGMDGMPIHTESHFRDMAESGKAKIVDVSAEYRSDHIDVVVITDGYKERQQIYPSFGMERFSGMFEPMIFSGLVQQSERDCAVLHPYTGMPYEFKLRIRQRWTGHYFGLPQEGYCVEAVGSQGNNKSYVTRQGQLIRVDLPDQMDASLELGPSGEETRHWGRFATKDWNRSTEETNPLRPKYNTLAVPVLFDKPRLLFPVPCVLSA